MDNFFEKKNTAIGVRIQSTTSKPKRAEKQREDKHRKISKTRSKPKRAVKQRRAAKQREDKHRKKSKRGASRPNRKEQL